MAERERKHHRHRRRIRFTKLYGLVSVLVIIAAIILGSIVFFRVNNVEVEGNERYTAEEIMAVADIEYGRNMFLFNKFDVIDDLLSRLPYVDTVTVRRDLPSTIRITVTESSVAAAVEDAERETWWLVNSKGKILERSATSGSYLQITGLNPYDPTVGEDLSVETEQRLSLEALLQLLPSLQDRELIDYAQYIDLSSASVVVMKYAERLTVRMNLSTDFDYNMRVLATVMEEYVEEEWSASDTGTLDLTNDDGLPHLIKDVG